MTVALQKTGVSAQTRSRLAFSAIVAPAQPVDLIRKPVRPAPATDGGPITSIQIAGLQRVKLETLHSFLRLSPGDHYTPESLDETVRYLFKSELFADAQIRDDDGALTILIRENPIICRVVLEGNKRINRGIIGKAIKLEPHQIFTRSEVRADVERIVEIYRLRGYLEASVDPQMVLLDQNRVDIVYEIYEGKKTINKIAHRENRTVDGEEFALRKRRDHEKIYSLSFFQDTFEVTQRQGSTPDRVILEINATENPAAELQLNAGFSNLECLILDASISHRQKGEKLCALVDLSHTAEQNNVGDNLDQILLADDEVNAVTDESAPNSEIIATKVGIDTFLDRKSSLIGMSSSELLKKSIGINPEEAIDFRVAELITIDYTLSFERTLLSLIYRKRVINQIQAIIVAERYLKFDDDSARRHVLAKSLEEPLKPVFDEAGYPASMRSNFVDRIVDEILSYDAVDRPPWAARVVKDVSGKRLASSTSQPLPETAPALWRDERLPGEKPPQFVMRVYEPWIGKQLTMADVRRLDEPLAQSLYHHIRKKRPMPEGFDLPTKHEQRERDAAALGAESDTKLREFLRNRQARYRANKRGRGD